MSNYVAKTFFNVIHEKSLVNMGIEPTWEDLPKLQSALEVAFNEIGGSYPWDGVRDFHDYFNGIYCI